MRKLSKVLALVLVLMMAFAVVSAFSFTSSAANIPAGTVLYLVPSANWNQSNARFAAYFFGSGETWVSMTKVAGESNLYQVTVPAGSWTNVIFCRMNPSASANNWNNKWNQTSDLVYNGTSNCYTVKEGTWDKGGGTWSTYGSSCAHTNVGAAATCTNDQVCLDCGDPVVSALGHTYNSAHLCTRCNGQATFTVAGSGAHLGTEWDTGNVANDMTYADGVYTKVYTNVAAGSYLLKVVRDHDWGTAYPDADKAYTVSTAGSTVTVTLKGTTVTVTVEVPHVHSYEAVVTAPTYTDGGYTTYTCSCGESYVDDYTDKVVPAFPEATVTPVENADLTFALNFGIKGVSFVDGEIVLDPEVLTEEYIAAVLETYGRMYVDYRLTISGLSDPSVTLNSDGTADGFLGGQYDAWSENWVCVPFGDSVVIENGKSLMIMEYAAKMMGQAGLRQILEEIITVVIDFDCGVYFTPEFLEHNPDMVVTLELLVFNEDENGELTDVITVAENVFTVPHTHKHVAAVTAPTCTEAGYTTYTCDCGDTYTGDEVAALGHDYKNGAKCADCEAVPANDYLINFSEWRPFDKGTFADGDTVKYNDIFTFIYGKNSRVDASAKTWDDLSATLRFSLGGKTNSGVPTKNAIQITVDAAYTLKIWYVAGGDARNFVLVDAEGNVLSETTTETVKNGQYYAELELAAAGTYYLTIPADNNYIFQLELVKVPHEHTWVDATCTAPKTCSGCGETEGEALGHTYYYNLCLVCYEANPYFIYNFTTVGDNKLVCNEYHLVENEGGHGKPYQFTLVTIPEDGLYIFTADPTKLGVFIYTIEINTEGADFSTGGASWAVMAFGQAELKAGQYYLGFIFYAGEGEYDLTITKHEHEFVEGSCACGAEDPNYVAPHEHNFVEGKCECGETDPDYVAPVEPVEPQEELNFFQKILAWFMELIQKLLAIFKR